MKQSARNLIGGAVALALILALAPSRPSATAQPPGKASPAQPAWKDLFDGKSLDGWKDPEFSNDSKPSVKDGAIVMTKGDYMTGVTYARGDFPKTDFEVSLEGKRVEGDDFFCTTTFPVGDAFCSLVVGGWGGPIVGLSSIDGQDASMNETSGYKKFERDKWYRVRIRVTKDRIQAWIDDERVVNLVVDDQKFSVRRECDPSKPFGIATWRTTGAVRAIRVRALTDAEKKEAGKKDGGERPSLQ